MLLKSNFNVNDKYFLIVLNIILRLRLLNVILEVISLLLVF